VVWTNFAVEVSSWPGTCVCLAVPSGGRMSSAFKAGYEVCFSGVLVGGVGRED
jgi:hypothetical protein